MVLDLGKKYGVQYETWGRTSAYCRISASDRYQVVVEIDKVDVGIDGMVPFGIYFWSPRCDAIGRVEDVQMRKPKGKGIHDTP